MDMKLFLNNPAEPQFDFGEYLATLGFEFPAKAPAAPPVTPLEQLKTQALGCTLCPLSQGRTQVVWGQGSSSPKVLFVGSAPSSSDEGSGRAFSGPSGELLERMMLAMGLSGDDVFLTHSVQCRPPNDRHPTDAERTACRGYLQAKIRELKPKVVVALGEEASKAILEETSSWNFESIRGRLQAIPSEPNLRFIATYHPAYLLKNPEAKKAAWADLQIVMKEYET
jgi:uracil-DNA glycosylase family 4